MSPGREEEVRDLLIRAWGSEADYGIVTIGLGGGTGSGTGPKLVEIARQHMEDAGKDPKVGVVVSLPSVDEGGPVCSHPRSALCASECSVTSASKERADGVAWVPGAPGLTRVIVAVRTGQIR